MKKFILLLVMFIFVSGCKINGSNQHFFETKDESITNYIEENSFKGSILEIDLEGQETVLLFKQMKDVYYLGEVAISKEKYSLSRTSDGVDIGNTTGAMWEFKTFQGNDYTLKISKNKEDSDSIFNKEYGLYISITNGKRQYEDKNTVNIIRSNQIIFIQ
ncbi:hypothetical protein D3C74_313440 [compost metagenome]